MGIDIDIETLKAVINNPLYIFAIIGISYIINEVRSIRGIKEKVNINENEISHLKDDINELKRKLETLDNEHREYTRKRGKH